MLKDRDCAPPNIMMDGRPLFPRGWHPQASHRYPDGKIMPKASQSPSRTAVGGVRYYFIDFGISTRDQDLVLGDLGVIRAPEVSDEVPYNPFKVDIYILGSTYKEIITEVIRFHVHEFARR